MKASWHQRLVCGRRAQVRNAASRASSRKHGIEAAEIGKSVSISGAHVRQVLMHPLIERRIPSAVAS